MSHSDLPMILWLLVINASVFAAGFVFGVAWMMTAPETREADDTLSPTALEGTSP